MNNHQCTQMPDKGIYINFLEGINEEENVWQLNIQREATESDLMENHYLEYEGETIWSTTLEITHYPYCGKKLPGLENINHRNYGKFSHFDSGNW